MNKDGKSKKIVLEAEKGIIFRIQEVSEQIIIKAIKEYIPHIYYGDYTSPRVPKGFIHIGGTWDTGFVIQNTADGSEFVWIPVGCLDADGTLDGENFAEKLGRRKFDDSVFSDSECHEEINVEFLESVKTHGGFYFARYHASIENEKLVFKKGKKSWVNIDYYGAEEVVEDYLKDNDNVGSILPTGAAFDSVLSWLIKSGAKTYDEIAKDATSWGNYNNSHKDRNYKGLQLTGSNEKWCANNIYDIAGNVDEWTSEESSDCKKRIIRGGNCLVDGDNWSPGIRDENISCESITLSFRAILYLKDYLPF